MTIKHFRLGRAENLTQAERDANHLTINEGLIIIEIRNPDLREEFKQIGEGKTITDYLLELGQFNDCEIPDN